MRNESLLEYLFTYLKQKDSETVGLWARGRVKKIVKELEWNRQEQEGRVKKMLKDIKKEG
jgi:hypothetical protein